MSNPESPDPVYAGIVRRLLAITYDSLLLLGVAFAYGVIITVIRVSLMGEDAEGFIKLPVVLHLASWLVLWLLLAAYYVLCWTKRGQTLGMKTWRLKLETKDGRFVDQRTAWLRCLLALVSAAPLALGYIWCLFDKKNGCWHDRWTHTQITLEPKVKT
jgi:uncharacterized RDD family membrane protein YckC